MPRKGDENLIPLNQRTKEEQREIQKKGGLKSGESRRRAKKQKDRLRTILDIVPNMDLFLTKGSNRKHFEALGITPDAIGDIEALTDLITILSAMKGNLEAKKYIDERTGNNPALKLKQEELKLKKRELKLKEVAASKSESGGAGEAVRIIDDL